jgi:hypothetical protein
VCEFSIADAWQFDVTLAKLRPNLEYPTREIIMRLGLGACTLLAVASLVGTARADLIFKGSGTSKDPISIAATADFSYDSTTNTLTVVLTNTGAPLVGVPASQASVLTELLFNGTPAISPLPGPNGLAVLTAGSSLVQESGPPSTDTVGANWQYISGVGVGTTGINFGPSGNLCGSVGCSVDMVDGSGYGLVPALSTLTSDGLPSNTYIENSATFTLVFPAGSFVLSDITSVSFVYGTGSGDKTVLPGVDAPAPEPGSLVLLGTALPALGFLIRRRKSN